MYNLTAQVDSNRFVRRRKWATLERHLSNPNPGNNHSLVQRLGDKKYHESGIYEQIWRARGGRRAESDGSKSYGCRDLSFEKSSIVPAN